MLVKVLVALKDVVKSLQSTRLVGTVGFVKLILGPPAIVTSTVLAKKKVLSVAEPT
jgi:DMSO/TMAO reductase YedYZ heme-binding membrane subunit